MKCAYCHEREDYTREHIISNAVLKLFPECNITYDHVREITHGADPIVKDVCTECNNNGLTYLDDYGREIVETFFLKNYTKDDTLDFKYDYTLLSKVLLKYAYNAKRSHNEDVSYFNSDITDYLLAKQETTQKKFTVLAGLSVNCSPMPEWFLGNQKLQWFSNPIFFESPMVRMDFLTGEVTVQEKRTLEIEGLEFSYMFKFNSGIFILLCWKDDCKDYQNYSKALTYAYPYKLLVDTASVVNLERATHAYNCHHPQFIDLFCGLEIADQTNAMMPFSMDPVAVQKELNEPWEEQEAILRQNNIHKMQKKKKKKKKRK